MQHDPLNPAARSSLASARTEHAKDERAGEEPSNTSPAISILRFGVDSLYLSFRGELHDEGRIRLEEARNSARSDSEQDRPLAQISLLDHLFQAGVSGGKLYRYLLQDHAYRIRLSGGRSKSVSLALCEIRSRYLTATGVEAAVDELRLILSAFATLEPGAGVSRLDLFVDFTAPYALDGWPDQAWVTRADFQDRHRVRGKFTGWSIGRGAMLARLYDKTEEIKVSRKDYLRALWSAKGWDGVAPVLRLEFQYRADALRQFGAQRYPGVMESLAGLWRYASEDWLRLTVPNPDDATRSRWPLHPLWTGIAAVPWAGTRVLERVGVEIGRVPADRRLMTAYVASLTSFMAARGITDATAAAVQLFEQSREFFEAESDRRGYGFDGYVRTRSSQKALQYGRPFLEDREAAKRRQGDAVAAAYRKAKGME